MEEKNKKNVFSKARASVGEFGGKIGETLNNAKEKANPFAEKAADTVKKQVQSAKVLIGAKVDGFRNNVNMANSKNSKNEQIKENHGTEETLLGNEKDNKIGNDTYIKNKKEMVFQSVEALQQVVNVVNEAASALNDKTKTIHESAIPEVLTGALGAGIGGVGSFAALYGLGTVGLSAVGITSGLATAGALVGGGMVAGVFVLALPVAALAAGGVGVATHLKNKQLRQEKERLYKEALSKHDAIIKALQEEAEADRERLEYLQSLNILLQQAIKDLQKDLGIDSISDKGE